MAQAKLEILFADNHLLVVNKPAGLPTQGAAAGEASVVTLAKDYLKREYNKPGNVYLGVVSRLDALVTGVLVLARTSKAAARLNEQFRETEVLKTYWAVVEGTPPATGALQDFIVKDERRQRMIVVSAHTPEAKEARLRYRTLATMPQRSLLEVTLETGRKHQIRLQLSSRGWPIVGDAKYDAQHSFPQGIALHARSLQIVHPTLKTPLHFVVPLPATWRAMGLSESEVSQFTQ